MEGTIKKVMKDKFFGFITVPGKKDVFFHKNDVNGFDQLEEGQNVTFDTQDSPKGPKAVNIEIVGE